MLRAPPPKRQKTSPTAVAYGDGSGVIEFFTTQKDLVREIARRIKSTRKLVRFMLLLSPEMRTAYTTDPRWNDVFDLRRRLEETWGRRYVCKGRNLLGLFLEWASNPRACLAGCGKLSLSSSPPTAGMRTCSHCLHTRVKHTSKEIAALRFAQLGRKHCYYYYYACFAGLPRRTCVDDYPNGMVPQADVLTYREARELCEREGRTFDYRKHSMEFWDHLGRCVGGTLECVLR